MERKGKARNGGGGFTLIELMLVVAILSVMVAIAIPKFGDMIARAHEASAKAHLGAIRGALRMEAASQEVNPEDLYLLGKLNLYDSTFRQLREKQPDIYDKTIKQIGKSLEYGVSI